MIKVYPLTNNQRDTREALLKTDGMEGFMGLSLIEHCKLMLGAILCDPNLCEQHKHDVRVIVSSLCYPRTTNDVELLKQLGVI